MKTKTKTLTVVEIAIVLCSVFLVAPAIAADQTTQKIGASAIGTTASEDEPLGIYGNANEDDIIDMRDTTYTKLIIFRKKPETKFADANHDGKVSMLDVGQIKLILFGKQKKLTVEDDFGTAVTFRFPIERFIYHGHNSYVYETLRALGVTDRIVGITHRFVAPGSNRYSENYYPELVGFTDVGILKSPDYEVINELEPDAVITDEKSHLESDKMPGIPVIAMDVKMRQMTENTRKYGYIFDKREEAEEYINWYKEWENMLNERTETLSEGEKRVVWFGKPTEKTCGIYAKDHYRNVMVSVAGANSLGDEISGYGSVKVDPEWVISRNPEVILSSGSNRFIGYDVYDAAEVKAVRDEYMSIPIWAEVKAIKNDEAYMISHAYTLCGGASGLIGSMYYAKWIYPDLFKDVDPQEMNQEFVTRFQHLDLNMEDIIIAYPPPAS